MAGSTEQSPQRTPRRGVPTWETPPPRTTGGLVAPGFTVSPRELRAKARALAGRSGCSPGASPAATALRPSRPPARGPPAATPEVQAAAAPPHRSGRGRGKCKLPADLDDDAFMRTAEEVDPDMPRDQAAEEDPPRDVPEGFTPCSVLPCRVGELIEVAKSQHRCRTCQGHFHAMCAAAANGSEDPNDCGCGKLATASPGKTTAVSISPPHGEEQVPQALLPPNAMRGQNDLLLAWKEGAEINSLARKPPKGFDQAMSEAWYQARDARRKWRNAEAQRKRRGGGRTAGKDATDAAGNDSPHDANPEYRAAAGKAPIAEATGAGRAPPVKAYEICRLVHAITDDKCKDAVDSLTVWVTNRGQLDDKQSRVHPWFIVEAVFNDQDFQPVNIFLEREDGTQELCAIDPGQAPQCHRSDATLRSEFPTLP
eukprot:jgi/Tetstr1/432186/TSEL_021642.t1